MGAEGEIEPPPHRLLVLEARGLLDIPALLARTAGAIFAAATRICRRHGCEPQRVCRSAWWGGAAAASWPAKWRARSRRTFGWSSRSEAHLRHRPRAVCSPARRARHSRNGCGLSRDQYRCQPPRSIRAPTASSLGKPVWSRREARARTSRSAPRTSGSAFTLRRFGSSPIAWRSGSARGVRFRPGPLVAPFFPRQG